jgi:hypothetical protein
MWKVKTHTKEELKYAVKYSTVSDKYRELILNWLYEALQIYAGAKWDRNRSENICLYIINSLDHNLQEQDWACAISSSEIHGGTHSRGMIGIGLENEFHIHAYKERGNLNL